MEYSSIESRDGPVARILHSGTSFAALVTNPQVFAAVDDLGQRIAHHAIRLRPEVIPATIREEAGQAIAALGAGIDTARREALDFAAADAIALTPPHNQPREKFPLIWDTWRTYDVPAAIERAGRTSLLELSALIDGGPEIVPLTETAWEIIKRRARTAFHAEKTGLAADHPMPPTLERIIATGPDHTAVETAAIAATERHDARRERIELEEQSLQQTIRLLAIMTDLDPNEVLQRALAS